MKNEVDNWILRAALYKTKIPRIFAQQYLSEIPGRTAALVAMDFLVFRNGRLSLTDLGEAHLRRISGGRLPPMIEPRNSDLLSAEEMRNSVVIGREIADEVADRISLGRWPWSSTGTPSRRS